MAEGQPLVVLMRRLTEPHLSAYDLLDKELKSLGFEQLELPVPARRDTVKFGASSAHKKGDTVVQLSTGTGREAGHEMSHISLSVMDKTSSFPDTVKEVADWLGAEPEYLAKAAQFTVLENGSAWTPIALAETKQWPTKLNGTLAHINVMDMGFGVSISRIVQRTK
ncbi:MAG: hypothetical protein H6924_03780 [Alphaproteobacteria bacterium]|nr:hypothetical protein [Alphaproteobacteria bacterium]